MVLKLQRLEVLFDRVTSNGAHQLTPEMTFYMLLMVQALHLLHHRLAKRHISFAEVAGAAILCLPLSVLPTWLIMGLHLSMTGIQIIGSVWIDRLSPDWKAANRPAP